MTNRFEVNDGVIFDTQTRLMWMQEPLDEIFSWYGACEIKHEFAGYNDWRLPTIEELLGIVDYTKSNPACNEEVFVFKDRKKLFWASSPNVGYASSAWFINFNNGYVNYNHQYESCSVRLVRNYGHVDYLLRNNSLPVRLVKTIKELARKKVY